MADSRYFRRGVTEVWFLASVAATSAPSLSADWAGTSGSGNWTRLTKQVAEMNGFTFQNNPITTPDLTDNFDSQIPGVDAVGNSDLVFYETTQALGKEGSDEAAMRTALKKGSTGFVVIAFAGTSGSGNKPAANDQVEVWPVLSAGPSRQYTLGNEAAKWRAGFSATSRPSTDASVVA